MSALADLQVTVVGLGLMGASLAGALRGKCRVVLGVARRNETAAEALARGLLDREVPQIGDHQGELLLVIRPSRGLPRVLDQHEADRRGVLLRERPEALVQLVVGDEDPAPARRVGLQRPQSPAEDRHPRAASKRPGRRPGVYRRM